MVKRSLTLPHNAPVGSWMIAMAWILGLYSIALGLQYSLGPDVWHQTTSQKVIDGLGVPWTVWGALYFIFGVLCVIPRLSPLGLLLDFLLFGSFASWIWEQFLFGHQGLVHLGLHGGLPPSVALGPTVLSAFYFFACRRMLFGDNDNVSNRGRPEDGTDRA